jgi:hypothetical protein
MRIAKLRFKSSIELLWERKLDVASRDACQSKNRRHC